MEQEDLRVVITSGESLNGLERLLSDRKRRPMVAPPLNLKELAALYQRCRVVVAGDTGPLHLAAAVGSLTVGLFGPSEARRSGPFYSASLQGYGKQHRIVQRQCLCRGESPYFPRRCREKIGCMEGIGVEEVYHTVKEILGRG
jgi:ADP-heptose:LPS heptosyltransferase